jgi:hypothetical protein
MGPSSFLNLLDRRGLPLALVAAVLLALPGLRSPLLLDDVVHRAMLEDRLPGVRWGPLELYDFVGAPDRSATVLRDHGSVPWFTADDLRLRFVRPLSSAVLAAEARLDERWLWIARLHSLTWFGICLVFVAALHRRVLARGSGLATIIYAVAAAHAMPISWLAARYALVCSAFGLLGVWCYLRAREDGWRAGRWVAPPALGAGLLAGETAMGAVALIAAWELTVARGTPGERLRAFAAVGALAAIYLVTYVVLGYGARASGIYLDAAGGLETWLTAGRRFLILAGEMIAGTPSDAFAAEPAFIQTLGAAWGAAAICAAWLICRVSREQTAVRLHGAVAWMAVAAATASLPGTLASLGGRVLTIALVPSSALVAVLILGALGAADRPDSMRAVRTALRIAAGGLLIAHLGLGPFVRAAAGVALARVAEETEAVAAATPSCDGTMVLVAAADPTIATYVPAVLARAARAPERLRVLSMAPGDHRVEHITETGFDLVTLRTDRERSLWELLYRRAPLPAGTRVTIPSLDALVAADSRGAPLRVRFDFGMPLSSRDLCFLHWRDGQLKELNLTGQTQVDLPHEPGPLGW